MGCSCGCRGALAPVAQPVVWMWPTPASSSPTSTPAPSMPVPMPRTPAMAGWPRGFGYNSDVTAPPFYNERVALAVRLLERALELAGGVSATITSWWRDASRNLSNGGDPNSQHLDGTAFDLRADAAGELVARAWVLLGGVVVDERNKPLMPHWHLQLA